MAYLNREPAATYSTTAGILPSRLNPFKNCVARLLASDRFKEGLGAGCSFPEWIPRPSAAALLAEGV